MGFKDAEWAYSAEILPMTQKVVLVAVCHRTDDRTHQTFVGQGTIAGMVGGSVDTVRRSLGVLDRMGVLTRQERHGQRGYRTSDLITVDVAFNLTSTQPTRQSARQADGSDLTSTQPPPTRQSAGAEEIIQRDHPEGHPVLSPRASFSDFWLVWPRSESKKDAEKAWARAIKVEDPDRIVASATAYANHPYRPEKQYVPYGATWLNGDKWNDPLPTAPEPARNRGTLTPDERAMQTLALVVDNAPKGITA